MPTRRQRQREVKRQLRAGHELAFSPVAFSGEKHLSHTIRHERGRYWTRTAEGDDLGPFFTFAAADRAGMKAPPNEMLPAIREERAN